MMWSVSFFYKIYHIDSENKIKQDIFNIRKKNTIIIWKMQIT